MASSSSVQETALEHLRIIRTLMERAHLYRAVSAPAALVGGILALVACAVLNLGAASLRGLSPTQTFVAVWFAVLAVAGMINLWLLVRESGSEGQPAVTDGLRMALRAVVPPLLCGGLVGTGMILVKEEPELGVIIWMLCYGLALQATVSFAPRSIIALARAFLIAGQVLFILWLFAPHLMERSVSNASLLMGATFGLFHLLYAGALLPARSPVARTNGPAATP